MIYPYPENTAEVAAVKAAQQLELPVFVVVCPQPEAPMWDVRLGWVVEDIPAGRHFLVEFADTPPPSVIGAEEEPFDPVEPETVRPERRGLARPNQTRFRSDVIKRYGLRCAVCSLEDIAQVLDAVHIRGKEHQGRDDSRNGLMLCATHHRAFDKELFAIEPETLEIRMCPQGPSAEALGVTRSSLQHLVKKPHEEALRWRWQHTSTISGG